MDDIEVSPHAANKMYGVLWIFVAFIIALSAALSFSWIAKQIPFSWEQAIDERLQLSRGLKKSLELSPAAEAALGKMHDRLFPLLPDDEKIQIQLHLSDNPQVNAMALPAGHIVLFCGLLKSSETPEELAAVLAHEIEHVRHRHIMEGMLHRLISWQALSGTPLESTQAIFSMTFTRSQEEEADTDSLVRLKMAQVDIKGAAEIYQRLLEIHGDIPAILSDHPSTKSRIDAAKRSKGPEKVRPILSADEWQELKDSCH